MAIGKYIGTALVAGATIVCAEQSATKTEYKGANKAPYIKEGIRYGKIIEKDMAGANFLREVVSDDVPDSLRTKKKAAPYLNDINKLDAAKSAEERKLITGKAIRYEVLNGGVKSTTYNMPMSPDSVIGQLPAAASAPASTPVGAAASQAASQAAGIETKLVADSNVVKQLKAQNQQKIADYNTANAIPVHNNICITVKQARAIGTNLENLVAVNILPKNWTENDRFAYDPMNKKAIVQDSEHKKKPLEIRVPAACVKELADYIKATKM